MKKQITLAMLAGLSLLSLGGCAVQQNTAHNPVIEPGKISSCDNKILSDLRDAIQYTSGNLEQLRKIKQGDWNGEFTSNPPPVGTSMQKKITLGWQGGVEDILRSIALKGGYKLQITGKKPPQPVIVNVDVIDEPIYKVLEHIGWQTGKNIAVIRNDVDRTIKLIYRKG